MLAIKIWGLPNSSEKMLREIHQSLVGETIKAEVGIKSQDDMMVFFPTDLMSYGLGECILIEISGRKITGNDLDKPFLPQLLTEAIKAIYPAAYVECRVIPFTGSERRWTSA